ncbi:tyrosine-type recombinase/integrase [Kriegella aquimaris]|uniref:Site-specific recombinase XerD n=1 Tax=Kriegella aquimaris TaxID=192904 RepID=A0A1G9V1C6_9FLAO|nr:site-specific integrase [Kriegella aquimaris]SDM65870.1 Site-specific recombinase XerD [Kriegella aquimaris]
MPAISVLLQNVHENVHVFSMKLNYSEPKIYTGGVDVDNWSKLSKKERTEALQKDWYVYFSFRDSETGKLKRLPNIKAGANRYKTKTKRLQFLKTLQRNLLLLLEYGFDPYKDNSELEAKFFGKTVKQEETKIQDPETVITQEPEPRPVVKEKPSPLPQAAPSETGVGTPQTPVQGEEAEQEEKVSVKEAFEIGLRIKKSILNENSYPKYKSHILKFQRWLEENMDDTSDITKIDKKTVIQYLNAILEKTSPRNRNNARGALSSFFTTLEDNEQITENFILKINVLKSVPERNKTYRPKQVEEIDLYLKKNDPVLRLFIQFISYNFLRPIEVCRLKVGDLDIEDGKLYVRAKNKAVKIKIIPEILLDELPDLSKMDREHSLFTPERIGGVWDTAEMNKRTYFTSRFKEVKEHFGLGKDYGLYSFRHTYITKLYREMEKTMTPLEVKSNLMLITGHTTQTALEKYLRDIDAVLPQDYSALFRSREVDN